MDDFKSIQVTGGKNKRLLIHNPTGYKLLGQGHQGAVFQLSSKRCVKIYLHKRDVKSESKVLTLAMGSPFFPKLYEVGSNYIVMEYMDGPTLMKYLKAKGYLPRSVTQQLIAMIREMKQLRLTRLDANLRHIYVLNDQSLKVIDHVNSLKKDHPYPKLILKDLQKIDLKETFLKQVKNDDRSLYKKWKKLMRNAD